MASLAYTSKIRPGTTKRIVAAIVREDDPGPYAIGDTPEKLLGFWDTVIATQPDFEPDKESVCVVLLNTRLRAFAWHRVSLGTVNESNAHPREILRPAKVPASPASTASASSSNCPTSSARPPPPSPAMISSSTARPWATPSMPSTCWNGTATTCARTATCAATTTCYGC